MDLSSQQSDLYPLMEPAWIALIRGQAALAERQGQLTGDQLAFIREREWFRLLIPSSIGGKEYPLPNLLETLEAASWMDGSFGWVMALCGGAGFFAGFVEEPLARSLFGKADVCAAGTGFPAGTATEVPGGYRVSGHWKYASGAPHATLYTANCRIVGERQNAADGKVADKEKADGQRADGLGDGVGELPIRAMIFLPDQVSLMDGWQSLGLRATASQDMIVENAFVPRSRSFMLDKPFPHATGPLFRYPFLQQAEAVLSVTLLGMTGHFLDLFAKNVLPRFKGKAADAVQVSFAESLAELTEARTGLYRVVNTSWEPYTRGVEASTDQLAEVGAAAVHASRSALHSTERLYPLGGMEMMQVHTEINRVWRDIHTASQHVLLSPIKRVLY
jgi:alkylation response protein AidB-like acyl-CoA dehydrogenase